MNPGPRSRSRRNVAIAAGALLLGGAVFWLWQRSHDQPPDEAQEVRESVESLAEPAAVRDDTEPRLLASRGPESRPQQQLGRDGVPIMAAHDDSSAYGPRHPHPITPQHQRIFRENSLIGALNGAMDARDFEAIRRLNEQYKTEYPEDAQLLQPGYDLIAECLQQRTPENRARAERYFNEELASTLRRYVRRYCLE
jgi:hypothetical protein